MGYTHYWYKALGEYPAQWSQFVEKCQAIITTAELQGTALGDGFGENKPVLDSTKVWLNGFGNESFETFAVLASPETNSWSSVRGGKVFDFCKTGYRPYDRVVTACLIALKCTHGDLVDISSDGEWVPDWNEGVALFEEATGIKVTQSVLTRDEVLA